MLNARLSSVVFVCVMTVSLLATPSQSQEDTTGEWRIRYHEPLGEMALEAVAEAPFDAGRASRGPSMRLSFDAFDRTFDLEIESNDRLIANLDEAGRNAMAVDLRLYRGSIVGEEGSWLRLTEAGGSWSGVIWDGVELYVIDPADAVALALEAPATRSSSRKGNIIYRLSDTQDLAPVHCGLDSGQGDSGGLSEQFGALRRSLESVEPLIAMATSEEALELVVVADAEFIAENGADSAMAVTSRINVVDGIFDSQVGVALSLVEIVELSSNGSLTATNAGQLLDQFSDMSFSGEIENPGLAHLFTGRNLDGTTAGVAYLRSICRLSSGVGLSETRGGGTRGAITVAHEIGHNFGAPHDNQGGSSCAATPSGFIMNPSLNFGGDTFSQCSLDQIAPIVAQAQCLVPVPEPNLATALLVGALGLAAIRRPSLARRDRSHSAQAPGARR